MTRDTGHREKTGEEAALPRKPAAAHGQEGRRGGQLPGPCRTAAHLAHSRKPRGGRPHTRAHSCTPPGTPGFEKCQNNGRERRVKKGGRGHARSSTLHRKAEKCCPSGAGEKKSCLQKSQTFPTLPQCMQCGTVFMSRSTTMVAHISQEIPVRQVYVQAATLYLKII